MPLDSEFKTSELAGGGIKKVLYTLNTARKIGLRKTSKAMLGKNTCKACGLGMGGQMGGMTNELGEFPSVCNKSIQAQSSDTQAAIPDEIFDLSINEFAKLSGYELEHLGRLNTPLYKKAKANHYQPVSWEFALKHASQRFSSIPPERSFFYSSGRASNEAGFILQLLARLYGTNNVNNCSYYCHQATSVALGTTIGSGTSTIKLEDLADCDLIFVIGANPASNHPRFIYNLTKCRSRGGRVVIINPAIEPGLVKFSLPKSPKSLIAGGTEVASDYIQPRIGTDMTVLKGIAKAIIEAEKHDQSFIDANTNGFESFAQDVANTSWEEITSLCGVDQDSIETIATHYANADKVVFAWGMGMTHHLNGVDNIEYIVNIALLRGMLGKQNAGLLPLRGHSNVQGIGTVGVKPELADTVLNNMINTLGITVPETEGLDTMGAMQRAYSGMIDAALIIGGQLIWCKSRF